MVSCEYKIKLKARRNEIEISGDKDFIYDIFKDAKFLLNNENNDLMILKKITNSNKFKEMKIYGKQFIIDNKNIQLKNIKEISEKEMIEISKSLNKDQIIILLAYYIKIVMQKRYFKSKDIIPLYSKFDIKKPKSLPYYLRKLSKGEDNYLEQVRRQGRFRISENGMILIENNFGSIP